MKLFSFTRLFLCEHQWLTEEPTYANGILAQRVICIHCATVHMLEAKIIHGILDQNVVTQEC